MTNKKTAKRAFLTSVAALILCFAMLLGSTYAWFTDSVTSGSNIIKSGTLDVAMYWADGTAAPDSATWKDASEGAIFKSELWEPGYTEVRHIKIANEGTLALKYQLNIVANGVVSELADVIDVYYVDPAVQVADRTALTDANKLGTLSEVLEQISTTASGNLLAGEAHTVTLALKMREDAGNEYQGLAIGSNFSIQLLATQLTSEKDSFDDQYDADALFYNVLVTTDAELRAAIEDEDVNFIAIDGDLTYNWGGASYENSKALLMTGKTFIGFNGDDSITFEGYGSANPIIDVTFKNITVCDKTVGDDETAWEHGHLEFESLTADNVVFADTIMLAGNSTLTNCSMNNETTSWYGVWVEGGNTVLENCTFTGTRAVKIHEAYGPDVVTVTIKNCSFSVEEKPGVVIGVLDADTTVSITDSTFINCKAGDQGMYIYESDTDVTTFNFVNENNTVLKNVVLKIGTAEEMVAFAKSVNEGGETYSGETVILTADIDLADIDWEPIGQTGATEFKGTFDGQGYTIKNLTIDSSDETGEHYSSGLFGWTEDHGSNIVVKNVNVDGATVKGNHNVAVIMGYTYGADIINCHVTNATIVCNHANDEACGDKAGVIGGYVADESKVTGCSATNCTVTAGRDAGQLIGCGYTASVSGCSAANVTVSATDDCEKEANINEAIIGRVMP